MILLYLLLVPLVFSDDSDDADTVPSRIPVFPKKDCVGQFGMICLAPQTCGSPLLIEYTSASLPLCNLQVIFMQYDAKKMLVELWTEGTSIEVVYTEKAGNGRSNKIVMSFEVVEETIKPNQMINKNFKLLSYAVDGNKIYVKFYSDSFPETIEYGDKIDDLTFKVASSYNINRDNLHVLFKSRLSKYCPVSTLTSILKPPELNPGTYMTDVPAERLFATLITCKQKSDLFFEKERDTAKKALSIGCVRGANSLQYEIKEDEDNTHLVEVKSKLKLGCLHKICNACTDQQLPYEGTDREEIEEELVDDCPVHYCPRSLLETEDGIVFSNITCAKISEKEFAWSANNKKLTSVKCAKEVPCHVVSSFKCEDPSCSKLTNRTASPIRCQNEMKMYFEPTGESKVEIKELTCNNETGQYMIPNGDPLPNGAKVICEGVSGSARSDGTTTGEMDYIAIGVAAGIVLIIVIVVGIVCYRRRAKKSTAAVGTTTRQETGGTSKSSEAPKDQLLVATTATDKSPVPRRDKPKTPSIQTPQTKRFAAQVSKIEDLKFASGPEPTSKRNAVVNIANNANANNANASDASGSGVGSEAGGTNKTKKKADKISSKQKKPQESEKESEKEREEKEEEKDETEQNGKKKRSIQTQVTYPTPTNPTFTNPTMSTPTKGRTNETQFEEKVEVTQRTQNVTIEQEVERIQTIQTMETQATNKKGKTPKKAEYNQLGMKSEEDSLLKKPTPIPKEKPILPPPSDNGGYECFDDVQKQEADLALKTQESTTTKEVRKQ